MNRAELLLLGLVLAGSLLSYAKYRSATAKAREAEARQLKGIKNRHREMQHNTTELCVICQLAVVAEDDIFDEDSQTWWHQACWHESVK